MPRARPTQPPLHPSLARLRAAIAAVVVTLAVSTTLVAETSSHPSSRDVPGTAAESGGRGEAGAGAGLRAWIARWTPGSATASQAPASSSDPPNLPATTTPVDGGPPASDDPGPAGGLPTAAPGGPYPPGGPGDAAPPNCPELPEIAAARVVKHGSRAIGKVVALTFDDGWDPDNVRKILAILQANRVNATFFPVGQAVVRAPDVWQAVAAAGFPIGNHTWDHARLTELCLAGQVRELRRADAAYARILGDARAPLLRPPYGAFDAATRVAATATTEQALVLWDIDTTDWSGSSAGTIRTRALAGREGSIVLLHTSPDATVAALPGIIDGYRARGFTFVTLGQLLSVDGPVPFP